ncbi:hypothetical protein BDK92_1297 [Micromonospora pisi]|uniref:Outer membrane channel protein CpnT-like N-terminal domain-containing protein n=1 Tax=Micromonospora pisi TaxID=589240 RepID=A0A495JDN5_9ACTN|nr:hypothetical protein [Micromonospora pisi]RKR87025.1 hypothetical protein BDK92_1297 [Micromonospora pisi]
MGLQLPGELADLLNELGYTWPKADETKMFELAQMWFGFADQVAPLPAQAHAAGQSVLAQNNGPATDAFAKLWTANSAAVPVLDNAVTGAQAIGAALIVCAAVVLALKISVIVQLTILLIQIIQAIATAAPTFGASLLEIPVFKKLADIAIDYLVGQALEALLG